MNLTTIQSSRAKVIVISSVAMIIATIMINIEDVAAEEKGGFKSQCGTAAQVAVQVGQCLTPIYDSISGKFPTPQKDQDIVDYCTRYNSTEKCVRDVAKRCLNGIHKSATVALANSIKTYRNKECRSAETRAPYISTIQCVDKHAPLMVNILRNHTALFTGISKQPVEPGQRLVAMCCLLASLDESIKNEFKNKCSPQHIKVAVNLVDSLTKDAREAADKQQQQQVATARGNQPNRARSIDSSKNAKCGTTEQVADRIEMCARPLMDILEGTLEKWPDSTQDIRDLCGRIVVAEKCIRDVGRNCLTGLRRTIVSALSGAVQRTRKRECSERMLAPLLSAIKCVEKHQDVIHDSMVNITSHLTIVRDQFDDLDDKTKGICCMITEIGRVIEANMSPFCKSEAKHMLRLYNGALEDVNDLICRSAKCDNFLQGYKVKKSNSYHGMIATMVIIVFSLDGTTTVA
ncbi:hypothetical protein GZH46_02404 [Fragariocoptes setiger]|uniref:Uncharacterized protein n=1 Tax=Fragariocoptes setiger TaxID=1670756 RepID=A0ABQ7S6M3_9ACAR|nr:hypothetical protein GZH46_02404 [Fragariocoptes setiger]